MERIPLMCKNMNTKDSSDSDSSDADSPPKIRKTRSTRTVRRPAACNTTNTDEPAKPAGLKKQLSVYSTRVTKCLDDFKSGRLQLCVEQEEEESPLLEKPKLSPKWPEKETISLDDTQDDQDCSHITSPESSFVRSRSPTPPPTPGQMVAQKPRRRRMNKHITKALKTLEGMKDQLAPTVDDNEEEEDDLVLVSHISSPLIEKSHITAMVRYRSKVHKYNMARVDTFHSLKTRLSAEVDVAPDSLFLMLGDRHILPSDTPRSVGLHIADILDCHLYHSGASENTEEDIPARDAISLNVQCRNRKNKILIKVNKHQPLRKLMSIYAQKVQTELSYLKFMFDGEDVMPSDIPELLDMEDDDTIDAIEV